LQRVRIRRLYRGGTTCLGPSSRLAAACSAQNGRRPSPNPNVDRIACESSFALWRSDAAPSAYAYNRARHPALSAAVPDGNHGPRHSWRCCRPLPCAMLLNLSLSSRILTTQVAALAARVWMEYEVDLDPTHNVIRLTVRAETVTLELAEDSRLFQREVPA